MNNSKYVQQRVHIYKLTKGFGVVLTRVLEVLIILAGGGGGVPKVFPSFKGGGHKHFYSVLMGGGLKTFQTRDFLIL